MDKIFGEIYLASEYDQFKLVKGNREVSVNLKLEYSIKKEGILRPIAVNSNMEILDGQHRYSIAKKYNIPLPYYVSTSKTLNDIIDLNNASHRWKIEDYIHKFKEDGLQDYVQLEALVKEHKYIALADLSSVAQGYFNKSYTSLNRIKEGSFKFVNYNEFIICLEDYKEFLYQTQIKSTTGVFSAFYNIYSVNKFELIHFVSRINEVDTKRKIIGIRDEKKILKEFVKAYNYKLVDGSKRYIDYTVKKDRNIIILEERKNNM